MPYGGAAATCGGSTKAGPGVVDAIRQTFVGSIRPGVGHAGFHHAVRRRLLTCNGTRLRCHARWQRGQWNDERAPLRDWRIGVPQTRQGSPARP